MRPNERFASPGRRSGTVAAVRAVVRVISWVLLFGAVGAAAAAWFTPQPLLEADDAATVAVGALEDVGFEGTVAGTPELTSHTPDDGDPVAAWTVFVDVDDDTVELRVQESAGQLVYVDDRIGADDTERLLTDDQFARIGDYRDDAVFRDWVARNVAATVAAALIAVSGFVIAKRSARIWR